MGECSDTVRQAYDAWNRADWGTVLGLLQPDVEVDATSRVLNPMTYRGREGFMQFVQEVFEVWEEWRIQVEELVEVDDRVLAAVRARARGRTSGLELDELAYHVWTPRDGRVAHVGFHYERDVALTAAGRATAR